MPETTTYAITALAFCVLTVIVGVAHAHLGLYRDALKFYGAACVELAAGLAFLFLI